MNKKVLIVTTGGCGGSERVIITFSKILKKNNFDVKLIILELNNKYELHPFLSEDIAYESFYVKKLKYSFFKLLNIVKREKPDYTLSSISLINVMLIIISIVFRNIKVIIRHGFMPQANLDGNKHLIKTFYPFAYKIIAQTKEMKIEMVNYYKFNENLITVINNPIDTELIQRSINSNNNIFPEKTINYIAVGRIAIVKDYLTLIKGFEIILNKNPNSHLYILGSEFDREYAKSIFQYVKEHQIISNIHFEGFVSNPYNYIVNSDCLVLTSISEGLPNVILEALYLKVPVVSTKCINFVEEIIYEGINGYTVDIGDYINLADKMQKAILIDKEKIMDFKTESDEQINYLFN